MKQKCVAAALAVMLGLMCGTGLSGRGLADTPSLIIDQLKVTTGNQFVTLYNPGTSSVDLSQIELDYINSSGKLSSLAVSGSVPAHGYYILSDGQLTTCYQAIIDGTSLGFATTSGSLQIWQFNAAGTVKTLQDAVSWSKSGGAGSVALPSDDSQFLQRATDDSGQPITGGGWDTVEPDASNPCQLDIIVQNPSSSGNPNPSNQLLPGSPPPATILSASSGSGGPSLPASDVGLMAPVVNELLPNPASPQTDADDEFIELYNPNAKAFDLSGFQLQTGSTTSSTRHTYTFPSGTTLAAKSFKAFYSSQTHLSMSNSGGQVWLLDPFGKTISQSGAYGTAKDGLAWALANGTWYWTTKPTPNAANVVQAAGSSSSSSSSKKSSTGSPVQAGTGSSSGVDDSSTVATLQPTPIHPAVLALIAAAALLYGAYEYRADVANRYYQFKKHRAARRKTRAKS